jgi:hypothetical protein
MSGSPFLWRRLAPADVLARHAKKNEQDEEGQEHLRTPFCGNSLDSSCSLETIGSLSELSAAATPPSR